MRRTRCCSGSPSHMLYYTERRSATHQFSDNRIQSSGNRRDTQGFLFVESPDRDPGFFAFPCSSRLCVRGRFVFLLNRNKSGILVSICFSHQRWCVLYKPSFIHIYHLFSSAYVPLLRIFGLLFPAVYEDLAIQYFPDSLPQLLIHRSFPHSLQAIHC
jgi:hypothetical protein